MELKDFIKVYDDVLDLNLCRNAIDLFEHDTEVVTRQEVQDFCKFDMLNMTEETETNNKKDWTVVHTQAIYAVKQYGEQYMKELDCESFWPKANSLEQIKMIKYGRQDYFKRHIDVGDYQSARRFLSYFIFLNDVVEGGELKFPLLDLSIQPKRGRVVLCPSSWQYPHEFGVPSNDSYMITTYLHYK
jgi:Rps23 Pro-64 3,4-dihydroxylase Tpa1-like proline 4-hydroxylase|tara:strand:- start:3674 stop:4234 length:561 start_codon:yes stop_codon:yes gene_type:complete